jgi:hypothetical protein
MAAAASAVTVRTFVALVGGSAVIHGAKPRIDSDGEVDVAVVHGHSVTVVGAMRSWR